ncbi:MAG: alpha/beta fold hydrolase, partial [Bacteroidia bacterium]
EEQALFKEMVRQHDSHDLRWALRALSGWQTPKLKPATTRAHIHGSKDLTFPIKRIQQPCHVIDGGGHFMTYRHPEKVDALLKKILKKN